MDLKDFNLEHWWKLTAAAGALIGVASATSQNKPAFLVGLGLFMFGCWGMDKSSARNGAWIRI
jgi:hypothetical protein